MPTLVTKLSHGEHLSVSEFLSLLLQDNNEIETKAGAIREHHFGNTIFLRGLIEISNYCRCNCYYCGIRRENERLTRYRLTREQILDACRVGAELGFHTFVLQGGEDTYWRGGRLVDLIKDIHGAYPEITITLSLGEMSSEQYQDLFDAGARRYLLRHETIHPSHYRHLHPKSQTLDHRLKALTSLKSIGYETGVGGMVGSPGQKLRYLAEDLYFIQEFQPDMIGIGPFLPHADTPFNNFPPGDLSLTLRMVALCRLICPTANIPATTAVATLSNRGREKAIKAGANVVMPNLSPPDYRSLYSLYDNKASYGSEAAEGLSLLRSELSRYGFSAY